jgi:hypothetical protein
MSIQIINGTPHVINIYSESDCTFAAEVRKLIVNPGAVPIMVIDKGNPLNAVKTNLPAPSLETDLPLVGAVKFTGHDPVPAGDVIIVSNLYRSAVLECGGDTSTLATVNGTVYSSLDDPKPCGCTGLAVG